ncbi:hypothetical protein C0J45_12069 [Silurus meridionalis]|nr:hypothetical protein C0J45_12069 [Silurus meridionalis]
MAIGAVATPVYYVGAGGEGLCLNRSGRWMSAHHVGVIRAYQADLLWELDVGDIMGSQILEHWRTADLALQATKETAKAIGRSMATLTTTERHLWLTLSGIPDRDKAVLLDTPLSPSGRVVADMMERRKVDMLCVQETKWKGSKARNIGGGFKLFYHGVDEKRNGVGVILKEEYSKCVVEVKRVSDRVMIVKMEVEGVMINVISAYATQVGCEMEEKEKFWSEGNRVDEEVMGRYGFKERNVEGQMVVDFARRMEMAMLNTYFKKKEDHRVTYKSGGKCTQVDYVLCRRCNLKEIGDCKVLAGDSGARQHQMVVCRMVLVVKKKSRRTRTERRIRWWKVKEEDYGERFRKEVRQGLGGGEEVLDDWATTSDKEDS